MRKYTYLLLGLLTILVACNPKAESLPLQVIFTNDSHSQIDPIKNKGGFEARAAVIDSLRNLNPNTLLLDAGDMWQGTPYFNLFKGKLEVEAYNMMGYDAATLGNHEFDYGIDSLAARIDEMDFPMLCCNYDFTNTVLANRVLPYTVKEMGNMTVGIIGVSVNPEGLILQSNCEGIRYEDPIERVNHYARLLRNELGCDYIIVLSHLGLHDDTIFDNVADSALIANSTDIDLVLGGHTHQYNGVFYFANLNGDSIPAIQEYKAGQKIYAITIH